MIENGWTTAYAARRIAWHVLDHAWEMQDRRYAGGVAGPGHQGEYAGRTSPAS